MFAQMARVPSTNQEKQTKPERNQTKCFEIANKRAIMRIHYYKLPITILGHRTKKPKSHNTKQYCLHRKKITNQGAGSGIRCLAPGAHHLLAAAVAPLSRRIEGGGRNPDNWKRAGRSGGGEDAGNDLGGRG